MPKPILPVGTLVRVTSLAVCGGMVPYDSVGRIVDGTHHQCPCLPGWYWLAFDTLPEPWNNTPLEDTEFEPLD
jgi:hypothetical protein